MDNGVTCNECRWKTERGECPWDYMYADTDYADDCTDFRSIHLSQDAFKDDSQ